MAEHDDNTVDNDHRSGGKTPSIRQIDRYRILHVIGSGGMATVYAALQPRPRRTVAMKVLRPEVIDDISVRRFRREAEILARLRHPSIAQVYDAGTYEQDGRSCPYFVMEFIPGARTILEYVAQKQFNRRDRLKLFVNVCRAVQYGHQHRVLHRDLKPGNILIDQAGRLKIIDFGVASAPDLHVSGTTMNTEAGRLVGTIQYMSPEQVAADPQNIDVRSDVYALGVLLYKLMTGQFPYRVEGQPIYEAVRIVREEEPTRPNKHDAELRGDLETIILRAIAKDRTQRYQSASDMAGDVVRFLNRQPIKAASAGVTYRSRLWMQRKRKVIAGVVVVLLLVGGAIGGTAWWMSGNSAADDANTAAEVGSNAATARSGRDDAGASGQMGSSLRPMVLDRQREAISALQFDGTGTRLASGSEDATTVLWDMQTTQPISTLVEHEARVRAVAFSDSGERLASLDDNGIVQVWSASQASPVQTIEVPGQDVYSLVMDAAGDRLAVACGDSTVRVMDIESGKWTTLRGTTGAFHCAAFSADGGLLAAGSANGDLYIWDAAGGQRQHRLTDSRGAPAFVMFDASAMYVVSVAGDGRSAVWSLREDDASLIERDPVMSRFNACPDPLVAACAASSRQWLVAASYDRVRLWDLRSLAASERVEQHGVTITLERNVQSIAIDANAQRLAIGRADGSVHIYAVTDLLDWAQRHNAPDSTNAE